MFNTKSMYYAVGRGDNDSFEEDVAEFERNIHPRVFREPSNFDLHGLAFYERQYTWDDSFRL